MNLTSTQTPRPKLSNLQLQCWLKHPLEKMLSVYSRLWIEEQMSVETEWNNSDVMRLIDSMVQFPSGASFDLNDPKTWAIYAEAMHSYEEKRWLIRDIYDEYLANEDYSSEEKNKLRAAWIKTMPTPKTFMFNAVERFFPIEYKGLLLSALNPEVPPTEKCL